MKSLPSLPGRAAKLQSASVLCEGELWEESGNRRDLFVGVLGNLTEEGAGGQTVSMLKWGEGFSFCLRGRVDAKLEFTQRLHSAAVLTAA